MEILSPDLDQETLGSELAEKLGVAQNLLLSRPRISIRLRFVLSLILCFSLYGGMTGLTVNLLHREHDQLRLLEVAEMLNFQVQQARRFEKNFFLYGTNLEDAREHLRQVEKILETPKWNSHAMSPSDLAVLRRDLEAYGHLLDQCHAPLASGQGQSRRKALESGLREYGGEIARLIEALTTGQQVVAERALQLAENAHIFLLVALFASFVIIAYLFLHALMDPLRRFQSYTQRIARGDFSLIAPARPFRDEFSDLALAVNRMLAEIQANQERCLRTGQLATVGTITSGIAHELNNPLNNVSLTLESFMERFHRLSDERKWKLLQDAYFETERMSEIVKSLLDFTRKEQPDLIPIDLSDIIMSTQKLVQNEMVLGNVTFECDIPAGLPRIRGATNQLRQVFLNLFINAVQAMPDGGTLLVQASRQGADFICVQVSDTGPGIPPEHLSRLFVPFFTTKEPGKGTGLGLSVSYSIIKKHGGDIQVRTKPGIGTSFHVCLPSDEAS